MKKSTSFHRISADKTGLLYKIFARLVHTPFNFINNLNPNKEVDKNINIKNFKIKNLEKHYPKLEKLASPSRKLSDLFWINLDWKNLKNELGEINICDFGCGSGNYFFKLQQYSNNCISNYTGLDIYEHQNWKALTAKNKNLHFYKYNGLEMLKNIPEKTNLIMSQSAIEHFSEDLTIFKQIQEFVKKSKHNVYQIHLFPSKVGVKIFPFHGVRQYTPRNISKITKLFSAFSDIDLYHLGGENSNKVHLKYIRSGILNKDVRKIKPNAYYNACLLALKEDGQEENMKTPSFYTLIIKSKSNE